VIDLSRAEGSRLLRIGVQNVDNIREHTAGGSTAERQDAGSVAPMVAVMGLALLLITGLVIDSSRQLNARGRALAYAEEAARAGTAAADPADRDLKVDPAAAAARVAAYCADAMAADASLVVCQFVGANGTTVTARTRTEVPASLLGIVGVRRLSGEGDGSARPLVGTTRDDAN
jgi:hypothetical protein